MSQKPVIYLGNLNVVRDSHRVHLLILDDDPDLYFYVIPIGLNGKKYRKLFRIGSIVNRVVFGCKFKLLLVLNTHSRRIVSRT